MTDINLIPLSALPARLYQLTGTHVPVTTRTILNRALDDMLPGAVKVLGRWGVPNDRLHDVAVALGMMPAPAEDDKVAA